MGKEKARKQMIEEFSKTPPTLYKIPVKIKDKGSYLGEEVGKNVSECVTLTLNKRIGLAKKFILKLKVLLKTAAAK